MSFGKENTYDDLICYSGFAFRVEVHEGMCPSAGHPCCGFTCLENGFSALPWKTKLFETYPGSKPRDDQAAFEAEARAAVRKSIDRGIPVHYGNQEDGLIIGYADEGRRSRPSHFEPFAVYRFFRFWRYHSRISVWQ
jgi:hypothetical protein